MRRLFWLSLAVVMGMGLPAARDLQADEPRATGQGFELASICLGEKAPTDIVAAHVGGDGTVTEYRRTPPDLARLADDFRAEMKRTHGLTDKQIDQSVFSNPIILAETLCGGTKDCGTKSCRGKGSCVSRSTGNFSGCKCE